MKILSQDKKALETALLKAFSKNLDILMLAIPLNENGDVYDNLAKTQDIKLAEYKDCFITPSRISKQLVKSVLEQDNLKQITEIDISLSIDHQCFDSFLTMTVN